MKREVQARKRPGTGGRPLGPPSTSPSSKAPPSSQAPPPERAVSYQPGSRFPSSSVGFLRVSLTVSSWKLHVDSSNAAAPTPGAQCPGHITEPAPASPSLREPRLVSSRSPAGSGAASVSGKIAPRPDAARTFLPWVLHRFPSRPRTVSGGGFGVPGGSSGRPAVPPLGSAEPSSSPSWRRSGAQPCCPGASPSQSPLRRRP